VNKKLFEEFIERDQNQESAVIESMAIIANSQCWQIVEKHVGQSDPGIDLKLEKENRTIIIEAKGERPKQPNIDGRIQMGLGQIVSRMKDEEINREYRYCLVFPDTKSFVERVIPIRPRKLLQLYIMYVDCLNKSLRVLCPNKETIESSINLVSLF